MSNASRILDLKYKLMTIELLNLAKNYYTYRELSQMIGLPETVLSRYVKGHVLPTIERAEAMNNVLQRILRLDDELRKRIQLDDYGYFDNTKIIGDTLFLERAVQYAVDKFAGKRITKVLTAAVDGIPLSTLLAHRLGVKLVIAKKEREVGVREFLEEMYILPGSGVTVSLYVPRGIIRKNDSILIVDDVIDSGEAQSALIKIVERARGEVTGIFALISIGDGWKRLAEQGQYQVEAVLNIQPKGRGT
ncbi:MAG: helix-turn-helix domain-containing protein [Candidatus Bathyarchaeia archaeon]|nr:helix-turn-helix domain-containing protein [Candidatus Bathyarchaeota archaeon]